MISQYDDGVTGFWKIEVTAWNPLTDSLRKSDITTVNGIPTRIESFSVTDPFGPGEATFNLPAVTLLETVGGAGLWWLRDGTMVKISWIPTDASLEVLKQVNSEDMWKVNHLIYPHEQTWVGRLVSFEMSSRSGLQVQCLGLPRNLNGYRTQPSIISTPIPVERAIVNEVRKANQRHPSGISDVVVYLDDRTAAVWTEREAKKRRYWYLIPRGLAPGQKWSGVTTREVGRFQTLLDEYVQNLLNQMRTPFGRYTARMMTEDQLAITHQDMFVSSSTTGRVLIVNMAQPGIEANLSRDFSQTLTTVYGKVSNPISGLSYERAIYNPDGNSVWHKPFANLNRVDADRGGRSDRNVLRVRREVYDEWTSALAPDEAIVAAERHLATFSEPGWVGSLRIDGVDPVVWVGSGDTGQVLAGYPRQMITAGDIFRLDGLGGMNPGPVVLATQVQQSPESGQVSVEFDSKFRDYTTVAEVRERNRDALRPTFSSVTNPGYKLNIPDPILPWSDAKGAGFFPYTGAARWREALQHYNSTVEFPYSWEEITREFPPKDHPKMYSMIPRSEDGRGTKKNPIDPRVFWNVPDKDAITKKAGKRSRVLLAQAGEIDHVEMICVDADGNRRRDVTWHFSLWAVPVDASVTPRLPATKDEYPYGLVTRPALKAGGKGPWQYSKNGRHYLPDTPYPFYKQAWEALTVDGETKESVQDLTRMIRGWGTYAERCGYYPSSSRFTDVITGAFADSTDFSWDMVQHKGEQWTGRFLTDDAVETIPMGYVLIFCDDAPDDDLYFTGRFYKKWSQG